MHETLTYTSLPPLYIHEIEKLLTTSKENCECGDFGALGDFCDLDALGDIGGNDICDLSKAGDFGM